MFTRYSEKVCFFFRMHYAVIILVFVVGIIYGSHHIWIPRFLGTEIYYPITFNSAYHDEAISYGARANAFYNGDYLVGDIRLSEYKDGPSWMPLLNPAITGGLGILFGSLKTGFIISDFIFPAIIFLFLYLFMYELTRRKHPALLFASLFIFSPMLGMFFPPVTALNAKLLAKAFIPFLENGMPLPFTFFEEPKITFVFYIAAAYFLLRALVRGGTKNTVAAGIAFGILFYTYFYDWASFSAALGVMFLVFLACKDKGRAKRVFVISALGITVGNFYWFELLQSNAAYAYGDIVARIAPELSHQFRFASVWKSYLRIAVLLSLFWFFVRNNKNGKLFFAYFAGLLASYLLVVNAQVVTGFNIQPDHWYRTQFLAAAAVVFLLGLYVFDRWIAVRFKKKYLTGTLVAFLFFFFAGHTYSEYAYSAVHANEFAVSPKTLARYSWLQNNTDKWSVVGTFSFEDAYNISLHTHNRLFLPVGTDMAASEEEIWERFRILAKLLAVPVDSFARAAKDPAVLRPLFSHLYDSDKSFDSDFFYGSGECCILPEGRFHSELSSYVLLNRRALIEGGGVPYRLDYLWVRRAEKNIFSDVAIPEYFEKVYDDNDVAVYKNATR